MRRATIVIASVALALLILAVSCHRKPSDPSVLPDLSKCTRLEFRCPLGQMTYFFHSQDGLFDAEEKEHIRSCKTWMIEDPNRIRSFAEAVSRGKYEGQLLGEPLTHGLKVACYSAGRLITSLEADEGSLTTESGGMFRYPEIVLNQEMLDPPGIAILRPRWYCGLSIAKLHLSATEPVLRVSPYPAPTQWCDAVVENLRQRRGIENKTVRREYTDAQIAARFRCPTKQKPIDPNERLKPDDVIREDDVKRLNEPVRVWVCDYAMNPDCEPNSPKDTVLLFEAEPGWNQHGGPELFNFDNHDPKGGCILLNDGTIKFIRMKEELAQLRWKP
jgi:hypothetical protein